MIDRYFIREILRASSKTSFNWFIEYDRLGGDGKETNVIDSEDDKE